MIKLGRTGSETLTGSIRAPADSNITRAEENIRKLLLFLLAQARENEAGGKTASVALSRRPSSKACLTLMRSNWLHVQETVDYSTHPAVAQFFCSHYEGPAFLPWNTAGKEGKMGSIVGAGP